MSTTTDLEPCPYCGSPAEQPDWTAVIYCTNRDCEANNGGVCRETWQNRPQIVALQAEKTEREWKPIETAPKDGTDVLAYVPETDQQFVIYWHQHDKCWAYAVCELGTIYCIPTHWMPLPQPPLLAKHGKEAEAITFPKDAFKAIDFKPGKFTPEQIKQFNDRIEP